ncbi:hypothetical protein P8452_25934 [Trifolium repens]|nr:hypothetical protein P8452_25934 [Trifolium repens]
MSSHMEISSKGYLNWEAKRLYCRLWCSNDGSVVDCNILYNAFIVSFLLGHCGSRVLFLGRRSLVMQQQLHLPLRRRRWIWNRHNWFNASYKFGSSIGTIQEMTNNGSTIKVADRRLYRQLWIRAHHECGLNTWFLKGSH